MLIFPLPAMDRELFRSVRISPILGPSGAAAVVSNSLKYYLSDIRAEAARRGDAWEAHRHYTNPLELVHLHVDERHRHMHHDYFELVELAAFFDLAAPSPTAISCLSLTGRGSIGAIAARRRGRPDDLYADLPPTAALSLATLVHFCAGGYAGSVDIISAGSRSGGEASAPDLWRQIAHALCLQRRGGSLVVRICDVFAHASVDILALLASCYTSVVVAKPQACSCTDSAKYVVCRDFVFDKYAPLYDVLCASLAPAESGDLTYKDNAAAGEARVLWGATPLHFLSHVGVCNAVLGQRQI